MPFIAGFFSQVVLATKRSSGLSAILIWRFSFWGGLRAECARLRTRSGHPARPHHNHHVSTPAWQRAHAPTPAPTPQMRAPRTTAPPFARRNSPELQFLHCKFEHSFVERRIGLVGYDAPFTRVRSPVRFWHSVVPFLLVLSLQRRPTLQVPSCNQFITTWLVSNLPSKQSS